MHYFSTLFCKELYMFRTDLLPIIRSLDTVFAAIGICHTSYVDCQEARSGPRLLTVNITSMTNAYCMYTVSRLLLRDSKSVRDVESSLPNKGEK